MNKEQIALTAAITMTAITSAIALGVIATQRDYKVLLDNDDSEEKIENETDSETDSEQTEEWKKNQWVQWKNKLENDWNIFNQAMEEKMSEYIKTKDEEFTTWIRSIENKWTHFNPNIDKEFNSNVLRRSINWTEPQWRGWMKNEGRLYLDIEWKKWFYENQSNIDELIVKQWIKWKKDKIVSWLTSEWKVAEQKHWEEFENKKWATKLFQFGEKKKHEIFLERSSEEWDEWFEWVKEKDDIFINSILDQWKKWEFEKNIMYDQWTQSFINKWLNKKQWSVWIQERRNLVAKEKAKAAAKK
ncbi:tryptophan-rich antigen [Plasmodium gonderi]|uniref:Tryptophan-rich antigen n=1 Tax=Plasmodium gonderi TaxID=77519 RepID=A0A1Y1JQC0_PLAGO|nr:tryptophan-rich antigen [Plasmodium gonderi]GAW84691.1 tryptophan-rich antigen [Plasmodium gonderi]